MRSQAIARLTEQRTPPRPLTSGTANARFPLSPRDPGIIGAALTRPELAIGVIADPSHLAAEAIRLAFRAAPGRVVLVTDDLAAGGCPDGRYRLGEVEFDVAEGVARRADGTLVGTTITLIEAIRHACDIGIPTEAAVNAATCTPASLHPRAGVGLLRPGDHADIDDALHIRTVLQHGTPIEHPTDTGD
jgi:N-acetylglucosamine-6-phosphate deacetylase